jgi:thermostable 8-oxoguanine DNA glycosylase
MTEAKQTTGWQTMQQTLVNVQAAIAKGIDQMQRENLWEAYAISQFRYAAQQAAVCAEFLRATEAVTKAMLRCSDKGVS